VKAIDLVRVRYLDHLCRRLDILGAASHRYLNEARIPPDLLSHPDAVVGAHGLMVFLDAALADTGWRLLGFEAGATPLAEHGVVGRNVVQAPTLYQAVRRLLHGAQRESSFIEGRIAFDGDRVWICRTPTVGTRAQRQQIELYNLHLLLQLIRLALGDEAQPEAVCFTAVDEALLRDHPFLGRLSARFGGLFMGVAVPLEALAEPMPGTMGKEDGSPSQTEDVLRLDHLAALRRILQSQLPYQPTLETLSRSTGLSGRSLQRLLQNRGYSFSRLLQEVVLERALEYLHDPGLPVMEIARSLGYTDITHFSRAFRRMTGLSPSAYRRRIFAIAARWRGLDEEPLPPVTPATPSR